MTHFEFLSVAVAIIFALSVSRQISALPFVVDPKRFDWLHFGYFVGILAMQLQFWWRMWSLNDVENWDFLGFLMMMAVPILYYLASHIMVSSKPSSIDSWREYFQDKHRWLHGTIALAWLMGMGGALYLLGGGIPPAPFFVTVVLFVLSAAFHKRWLHALTLVWWLLLLFLIGMQLQSGLN
jgi:hypothetical protein